MFTEEQKKQIKERDNYECQLNKIFGIIELTEVQCSEDLDVHHKRYGENLTINDGIAICTRCHEYLTDMIRRIREQRRNHKIQLIDYDLNNPLK